VIEALITPSTVTRVEEAVGGRIAAWLAIALVATAFAAIGFANAKGIAATSTAAS
jgi:hypothetical protein